VHNSTRSALVGLGLLALIVAAYWPSLPGEFIWDDDAHITHNELLWEPGGLARIWVPHNTQQYYPVSFTAWWLQFRLFGHEPLGYHLVNLLLHAGSAILIWRLLHRLAVPGAVWIGLAFGLHPMNVESVAWAMELKNCLSLFLMLCSAHAYLRFDRVREERGSSAPAAWTLAFALFVLALLAKTVTATLPAALILAFLWMRRRVRLAPLVPFFVAGIGLGLFTAYIEKVDIRAEGDDFAFTLVDRFELATRALTHYASTLAWPRELLFVYPRVAPGTDPAGFAWRAALLVAVLAIVLRAWARGRRGAALSLFLFAGTLFPALGFVDVFPFVFSFVADHFAYIASIGFLAFLVGGLFTFAPAVARAPVAALACAALGVATWFHTHHYASGRALYEHTLEHNPEAWLCHSMLGTLDLREGREALARGSSAEARATFERGAATLARGLELRPNHPIMLFNLGFTLVNLGRYDEALVPARKAANRPPHSADSYAVVGLIQLRRGEESLARGWFERALAQDAANFTANMELGDLAATAGRPQEAREHYRAAERGAVDASSRARAREKLRRLQ